MDIDFAEFCPYDILRHYISEWPKYIRTSEPFFVFADNSPVIPVQMHRILKKIIAISGFNPEHYNCQSPCIGCASDMLKMGISVETIKKIGRWTSNAVFIYLRMLLHMVFNCFYHLLIIDPVVPVREMWIVGEGFLKSSFATL